MNPLTYAERLRRNIEAALTPTSLEIVDDSARHIGHAGHDPQGETHFKIKIVSSVFIGLTRVQRHRLVYETVSDELKERVHALNIEAFAPNERYNQK